MLCLILFSLVFVFCFVLGFFISFQIFRFAGLSLLCIFLIEIFLRLYVYRLSFFKRKLELFDSAVVVVAFTLEIILLTVNEASFGSGIIIILRLWRLVRIVNGNQSFKSCLISSIFGLRKDTKSVS